ncbi:hypothetical protein UY3_17434 [Chelonia mydas]|uniref:Uncharacterized protein n=1 Tax=Chelonia mydas TaxID=8469 RepID=M7BB83_CHEMY|nr:hypothetical protein UY3_17434 [Chelonia mydas]
MALWNVQNFKGDCPGLYEPHAGPATKGFIQALLATADCLRYEVFLMIVAVKDVKTCYTEQNAILGGDPTSIAKSPVEILTGLEAVERGPNLEGEVIDEEVELDDDVELLGESSSGVGNQELVTTPEVSSQSQQLLSGEQEAGEEMSGKWLWFV